MSNGIFPDLINENVDVEYAHQIVVLRVSTMAGVDCTAYMYLEATRPVLMHYSS